MTYRVLAIRADAGGCARYRVQEPARAVNERVPGIEVRVNTHVAVNAYRDRVSKFVQIQEVLEDVDLISVQRPLSSDLFYVLEQAKKQGIATCVELDDDFEFVHPRNVAWKGVQPELQPTSNYEWIHKAGAIVDHLTVSTPALERYAPHGRVSVVRNYVPLADVAAPGERVMPADSTVRVGWTGTLQTHPDDLDVTRGGVTRGVKEIGGRISVVGDMSGVREGLNAADVEITQTGWVPLDEYMSTMSENIDIGIVPLTNTPFNRAKSALKGIEYAARGIPFIASNLPEYTRLAAYGLGEIAVAPGDWRRHITRWARDDRFLAVGEQYRQAVAAEFTIEDHVQEWADAWVKAIEHRRAYSKVSVWTSSSSRAGS